MGAFGQLKRVLIGEPLESDQIHHEKIPKWKALAVLSSDALSSVAYATEEVLIPLAAFATAAVAWSLPIALAIATLLIIVTLSYRQTIEAYPNGGGAYTVARENLGETPGLIAGAALLIDYTLTVAVSVAAGVENISSAIPILAEHNVLIGFFVVLTMMFLNLRGVRESANVFALPTYFFIASIIILITTGLYRIATGSAITAAPLVHEMYPEIPLFLLLRAFSSGCAALTGVEAISNGIPIFRDPSKANAKTTLTWMSLILGTLFLGLTVLAHLFGVVPGEGQTAVSQLSLAVFGKNGAYYFVQFSTALILFLAANTSYADYPRLSSLLSRDGYLPRQLASLGDRLVFSNGVIGLSVGAIVLLVLFNGSTHHLIPLYSVGVFLSFTLSQAGMVVHHIKHREPRWLLSLAFNALGAVTTLTVLVVVSITKFAGGAWMVIVLIPATVFLFREIHTHYVATSRQLARSALQRAGTAHQLKHTAIVPISGIHGGVIKAVSYALSISRDVRACYVEIDPAATERTKRLWRDVAPGIPLAVLPSPYRSVIEPILDYVESVEKETRDEIVTVIIPEFVTPKWYHQFLHNQTALVLYAALRAKEGITVTSVRYHLSGG